MNLPFFIAKKLAFGGKNSISSSIIKIAIAAVALSVSVMIISVFMIKGFQYEISRKIFGFNGHINIHSFESDDDLSITPIKSYKEFAREIGSIKGIDYYNDENEILRTKGGVKHIQKFILYPAIIKSKTDYEGVILKGVADDFDRENMESYIIEGRLPNIKTDSIVKEIVVSKLTSNRLKLEIGNKVIANFINEGKQIRKALKVVGVYNTGLAEFDKKVALVNINLLRKVLGWQDSEIGGFEVFLDDINDMDIVNEYIHVEVLPSDVQSITIKDKEPFIFEWLELQNVNERVILILMLIVSIINMMTALLILILEKTNMIGVLKSMGMKSWSIRRIFLYHGAYIVVWGLLIGNFLGIGFSLIQKYYSIIKLDENSYYLSEAPIYIDFVSLVIINVGTLLITVISLILPSYLISKLDPVKSIRFK